jgi:PAS domain S-box-containing protein
MLRQTSTNTPTNDTSAIPSLETEIAYLEQIVENAPEAISILDLDLRIIRVNDEFTRLFGFAANDAHGKALDTLIVPPDRSAETVWIAESVGQGNKLSLETRRQRKDGSLVDVLVSASPVVVDGQRVATYASYRDITEQKRAEELNCALYAIAARAHSVENQQQFFAAIHGIVSQLMWAETFYIALLDFDQQLLHFPYFVDERHRPVSSPRTRFDRACRPAPASHSGDSNVFEDLVKRGDAELIGAASLDWLGVPLMGGNGCIGALVVQSYSENVRFGERDRDILKFVSQQIASAIEHKRYEEALRRSEARYRSLILSAAYGIYRCTIEGRFLDVNPALIAMLGYGSVEELLALDARRDVFFNFQELDRLIEDYHRTGSLNGVEVQWKAKDGHVIVVRLSGRPVSGAEQPAEELEISPRPSPTAANSKNNFGRPRK